MPDGVVAGLGLRQLGDQVVRIRETGGVDVGGGNENRAVLVCESGDMDDLSFAKLVRLGGWQGDSHIVCMKSDVLYLDGEEIVQAHEPGEA